MDKCIQVAAHAAFGPRFLLVFVDVKLSLAISLE